MIKTNLIFTGVLVMAASTALGESGTKRDLITRIYDIQCTGEGLNFGMMWDTALTPLGPVKAAIDGKEIPLGGMKMSFEKGDATYEVQEVKITLKEADKDKKTFETIAKYKNKDIKLNCTSNKSTKFLRKRKVGDAAEAEKHESKTTRDLMTRISEINCAGDGHDVEMTWDSAIAPMGPVSIVLDGRTLPLGGMTMALDKDGTAYEIKGLKIKLRSSDKGKKSFTPEAQYNGQNISLRCTNTESTKFLRKRPVEAPTTNSQRASGIR